MSRGEIIYSRELNGGTPEYVGALHAPSLNAAFRELYKASGIKPWVRPGGGDRTPAEQARINPGQVVSDHVKGRAKDTWNWAAIAAVIGMKRMRAILRKWGWDNIQINGVPFPQEPWHDANHLSRARLALLNLKTIAPRPPIKKEKRMELIALVATDPSGKQHFAHTVPGAPFFVELSKDDYNAIASVNGIKGAKVTWAAYTAYRDAAAR